MADEPPTPVEAHHRYSAEYAAALEKAAVPFDGSSEKETREELGLETRRDAQVPKYLTDFWAGSLEVPLNLVVRVAEKYTWSALELGEGRVPLASFLRGKPHVLQALREMSNESNDMSSAAGTGLVKGGSLRPEAKDCLQEIQRVRYYVHPRPFTHGLSMDDLQDAEPDSCFPFQVIGALPIPPCPDPSARMVHPADDRVDAWTKLAPEALVVSVRDQLTTHAERHPDRPIPRYQMVVDPNLYVRNGLWLPLEFDVDQNLRPELLGGEYAHEEASLACGVAGPILAEALPMLEALRRPALLLRDRRLQVVFKAQRIILPPATGPASDSEYVGLWHTDGDPERIVAVILFYYAKDPSLSGGDLEFAGQEHMDVLGAGDCSNNAEDFSRQSLRDAVRTPSGLFGPRGDAPLLPNARLAVEEGTLVVFSNAQLVHRVLRMVNGATDREASRDFVALFVVDPSHEPLFPARRQVFMERMLARTLCGERMAGPLDSAQAPPRLPADAVRGILDMACVTRGPAARHRERVRRLRAQLTPRGQFGSTSANIYATGVRMLSPHHGPRTSGHLLTRHPTRSHPLLPPSLLSAQNGCYTMVGWLDALLADGDSSDSDVSEFEEPKKLMARLNAAPRQDRGLSDVLSDNPPSDLSARVEAFFEARGKCGSDKSFSDPSEEGA